MQEGKMSPFGNGNRTAAIIKGLLVQRRLFSLIVVVVICLLALIIFVSVLDHSRSNKAIAVGINYEGYCKIKLGMTLPEVEAVLTDPTGRQIPDAFYRVGGGTVWGEEREGKLTANVDIRCWESPKARIFVHFD